MKSSVFLSIIGLSIFLFSSCDPFKPYYQNIEGNWEITQIKILDRTDRNGNSLADTLVQDALGELQFSFCDQESHATAQCQFTQLLLDGRSFTREYQIVNTDESQIVLSGQADGLKEHADLFGTYHFVLDEQTMMLRTETNSLSLMGTYFRGKTVEISLNRN